MPRTDSTEYMEHLNDKIDADRQDALNAAGGNSNKARRELEKAANNPDIPDHVRFRWGAAAASF